METHEFFAATGSLTNQMIELGRLVVSVEFLKSVGRCLIILAIAFALSAALRRVIQALGDRINLPRLALTPLQVVVRYGLWILAVLLVLDQFGVAVQNVMPVLATVLGLVAIGFVAVWSVLSNLLCTFVLIIFKPFSVGDEVEFPSDAVKGKVVDLSLLYTTLRAVDGGEYQIPNNMFFQKLFKRTQGARQIDLESQLHSEKPAG